MTTVVASVLDASGSNGQGGNGVGTGGVLLILYQKVSPKVICSTIHCIRMNSIIITDKTSIDMYR